MLSSAESQRIQALLKKLEFNETQTKIYLHCLASPPQTVQDIAHETKQNRITVHNALKELISRGLLAETYKGKKRLIIAEPPQALSKLVQQMDNELELIKTNLNFVENILTKIQPATDSRPTIKFYEGIEGLKKMLEDSLEAKTDVLVFTHVDLFSKLLYPDYLENYFQRRAQKGIHTKLIFPPCPFAKRVYQKSAQYKIQIKLMPQGLGWQSGFFTWNNTVAIKSFSKGKITCTIIENSDIAHFFQKVIYPMCWQQAKGFEC